ncbi:MAG: hypothetical protein KGL35_17360 [Bradyrhizobium sp.]|nr:hypothetical protein [Bradyrhizobium sp.]
MRLLADWPNLPACAVCQKYLVKYSWSSAEGSGEPLTYQSGPNEWLPVLRQPNQPAPCDKCPKESPEKEHEHILTAANYRALWHYREHRAVGFRGLSEEELADSVVRQNFELLNAAFERLAARRQGDMVGSSIRQAIADLQR